MSEIHKTRQTAEKSADDLLGKGKEFLDETKGQAEDLLEEIQGRGTDAWTDAKAWVRKNPGAALGCALVVGAVVSALLVRSSDD